MEICFPALEAHAIQKQSESHTLAQTEETVYASFSIQQLLVGFTPEEVALVKAVKYSYVHMLETIALVRRHKKGGDSLI